MAGDLTFAIRLTADGTAYVDGVRVAAAETKKLGDALAAVKAAGPDVGRGAAEGFKQTERGALSAAFATARARQELIVLAHEAVAGNFRRIPGSFLVLGEAAASSGVHIIGMAGAVAAAVAPVALLGLAMVKGAQEAAQFNQAILQSGNFAGTTRGQMLDLARDVASSGAVTLAAAKGIVEQLVASGRVGQQSLQAIANVTAEFAHATSADAEEITKAFVKVFADPVKGAAELNQTMHLLSIADLRYIEELQQMGREEDARIVLADKLHERLTSQEKDLGILERAWNAIKNAAGAAWDAMLGIGRAQSLQEKIGEQVQAIAALQNQVDERAAARGGFVNPQDQRRLDAGRAYLQTLLEQLRVEQDQAKAESDQAQQTSLLQRLHEGIKKSDFDRVAALRNELTLLDQQRAALIANGESAAAIDSRRLQLQKQIDGILNKGASGGHAAESALRQLSNELDTLEQRFRETATAQEAQLSPETVKGYKELGKLLAFDRITLEEYNKAVSDLIDKDGVLSAQQKELNAQEEAYAKILDALNAAQQKRVDGLREHLDAMDDETQALKDENEVLGLVGIARERELLQIQRRREVQQASNQVEIEAINRRYAERDAVLAARDATQQYVDAQREAFQEADGIGRSFFQDLFENGSKAFDNLGKAFRRLFVDELFKQLGRPFVVQLVGAFTSAGASGIANAAGLGPGAGTGFLSGLGSLVGGLGGNFFGGIGGAFGNIAAEGFIPGIAGSLSAGFTALGAGNIAGGVGSLIGGALPLAGPLIALASLLGGGGLFSKDPSHVRGQFGIRAGTGGFEDNAFTSTPFGNLGFLDEGTQYFSGQGAQAFNGVIASALNAIAGRLNPDQIARTSTRLQGINFSGREGEFTTEDFIKQYGGDVLKQVISTALEELDPALAKLVASFHGTAEETLAYANALLSLHDSLSADPVKDAETALRLSTQGSVRNLREQGSALRDLAAQYDRSMAQTTALAQATEAYRQSLTSVLVQIRQVQSAVSDMFGGTRETLETSGLDQQQLYEYYTGRADSTLDRIRASDDPALIQSLSQDVNRYISAAFGALSEDEQAANKNPLLAYLNAADTFVQNRLDTLFNTTAEEGKDPLKGVRAVLNDAADKQQAAANTQQQAAASMNDAANTMQSAANTLAGGIVVTIPGLSEVGG